MQVHKSLNTVSSELTLDTQNIKQTQVRRSMSNNQVPGGVFFTSEDQDHLTRSSGMIDYDIPLSFDPLSSWHSPLFSSVSLEEGHHEIGGYSNMLNDLSSFEAPSSLPLRQLDTSEIPCLEKIVLQGFQKGQSSGTKREQATNSHDMQIEETNEDDPEEDGKQQKRKYYTQKHNLNNRLRRQKIKEKLKTLQELIPKFTQGDEESILDDAIDYIQLLQYQLREQQMMYSKRGGDLPMSWPLPPLPGMGYGMGMEMEYPMTNFGFPSPTPLLAGASGLGLTLPLPYSNIPENILFEPWPETTSILSSSRSRSLIVATQEETNTITSSHSAYHAHHESSFIIN